jgi:hypothetical protein
MVIMDAPTTNRTMVVKFANCSTNTFMNSLSVRVRVSKGVLADRASIASMVSAG